jgi:hypothetical protein
MDQSSGLSGNRNRITEYDRSGAVDLKKNPESVLLVEEPAVSQENQGKTSCSRNDFISMRTRRIIPGCSYLTNEDSVRMHEIAKEIIDKLAEKGLTIRESLIVLALVDDQLIEKKLS